jgi:hypothetical protein
VLLQAFEHYQEKVVETFANDRDSHQHLHIGFVVKVYIGIKCAQVVLKAKAGKFHSFFIS